MEKWIRIFVHDIISKYSYINYRRIQIQSNPEMEDQVNKIERLASGLCSATKLLHEIRAIYTK